MTRVLVVAPTPALRAGLRALLLEAGAELAGEAAALGTPGAVPPDVDVVLVGDPALLEGGAAALAGEPRVALLLLADDDRPLAALRSLPLSGWGIVARDVGAAELAAAVAAVAQDLVVLPPALAAAALAGRPALPLAGEAEQLTGREREVLELIAQGLSNKLIARRLQISEHTVKFHISSIFAKLGAASRADAIGRGARLGLIAL